MFDTRSTLYENMISVAIGLSSILLVSIGGRPNGGLVRIGELRVGSDDDSQRSRVAEETENHDLKRFTGNDEMKSRPRKGSAFLHQCSLMKRI
jgi:hypothetical protein